MTGNDDGDYPEMYPDFSIWDAISQDALATPEKLPADETVDVMAQAAHRRADQAHDFRKSLFDTVRGSLIATLAASVVVMLIYMISQWGEISPAVLISFNTAVVVNTVGLAYIVANYLFPKGGGSE